MTRALPTFAVLALALPLAGLSACASVRLAPTKPAMARTPTENFPLKAVERAEEIRLVVHAAGLSTTQAAALAQFADTWANGEGGQITLSSPVGGPDAGAAFRTGEGARSFLVSQGVPADRIVIRGYDAAGDMQASLRVAYVRYEAVLPECGRSWGNLSRSFDNLPQSNFGCAVSANMAAQIANPADIVRPRTMTPADAGRRSVVLDKYRRGEVVSSEKDAQAQGVISDAIK